MTTTFPDSGIGLDPFDAAARALSPAALSALSTLHQTLTDHIRPLMAQAWEKAQMPREVRDRLVPLNLMEPAGVDDAEARSSVYAGFRTLVLARCDASVATFINSQTGLLRAAILRGASADRVAALERDVIDFRTMGAFALTEPDHGSDVAGGMTTTAARDGDDWVISGTKRWIGAADTADVIIVFCRDAHSDDSRAFMVPRDATGLRLERIENKVSLRPMQNFTITLDEVRVASDARLERIQSWSDVADVLAATRTDVSWIAAGIQAGALDAAVSYANERQQFGHPIGAYQLTQEKLFRITANLAGSIGLALALSQQQDAGTATAAQAALTKAQTTRWARESVALAREIQGGNGITTDFDAARFFADAEAAYSYEGTYDMNALIVGRALTGVPAFTRTAPSATESPAPQTKGLS